MKSILYFMFKQINRLKFQRQRPMISGLFGLMGMIFLGSCASETTGTLPPPTLPPGEQAAPETTRKFRVGDGLELMVEEDSSFNGLYGVRSEGYVLIPKLGRIPVLGLTRDSAERRVKDYLQRSQLTQATVFVELIASGADPQVVAAQQQRIRVFITGKVGNPGQHQIPVISGRNPGVYEVLLIAGGATKFGNLSKVEIMRLDRAGLRQKQVVDVLAIQQGKANDVALGDGDIVNVPQKVFGF